MTQKLGKTGYLVEGNMVKLRLVVIFALLMALVPSWALGQEGTIEISSSPNPVGSGARALGMGGAFIGVADDATAASWNPAGLIQLETPEVSIVGAYNGRTEDTTYEAFPEASGDQRVTTYEVNYLSLAYPFTAGQKNMIISLNYQHLYDFEKKVNYSYTFTHPGPPALTLNNDLNFEQEGALRAISPAFAIQIHPKLSLGFTLNIWDKNFCHWESTYHTTGNGTLGPFGFLEETEIKENWDFSGINYHAGILWNINSTFTLGGVFKAPFHATLKHRYDYVSDRTFPTVPAANTHTVISRSDEQTLEMPMSYGIGVAARLSDALTLDLDAYRTEWSDYVRHGADGQDWNPVTGKHNSLSECKATTQVRLGGEYLIIGKSMVIPLRAGLFYDPEPSEDSPDDFLGFSLGSGIAYKGVVYDIAYQYRFGRDVRTTTVGNEDSSQDVDQHTIYMSLICHF